LENSRSLGPMCELHHGMSCHSTLRGIHKGTVRSSLI
jgi:hypothetical protein